MRNGQSGGRPRKPVEDRMVGLCTPVHPSVRDWFKEHTTPDERRKLLDQYMMETEARNAVQRG